MTEDAERTQPKLWVDVLTDKHERWPYQRNESVALDVQLGPRAVRVLVPPRWADVDVLAAVELGRLAVILGSWRNTWARQMNADGVVMIATPLEGDTYAIGVWHQLHVGTLDALRFFLP